MGHMKWVDSEGGPLVLMGEALLSNWRGCFGPARGSTDYDRACQVDDYVGVIDVGNGKGLVLGDEPMPTAWVPRANGGILARVGYTPSKKATEQQLAQLGDIAFQPAGLRIPLAARNLLFDSALAGTDARQEGLLVQLEEGLYQVGVSDHRPTTDMWLVLLKLERINPDALAER
jgi:hypothetical protein